MTCAFLFFGAVGATTHLFTNSAVPQAGRPAVGVSQPDIHAAALPAPGWSGNVQPVIVSDTTGPAGMAAQLTTGAGVFGAALVTGLLGRYLARRQVAPAADQSVELGRRLLARSAPRARIVMMADAPTKEKTEEKADAKEKKA